MKYPVDNTIVISSRLPAGFLFQTFEDGTIRAYLIVQGDKRNPPQIKQQLSAEELKYIRIGVVKGVYSDSDRLTFLAFVRDMVRQEKEHKGLDLAG